MHGLHIHHRRSGSRRKEVSTSANLISASSIMRGEFHGSTLVFGVEKAVEFQVGVKLSVQKVILGFQLQWWLRSQVGGEGSA